MTPALVAVTGLAFTVLVALIGAVVALLKVSFTLGKMTHRLESLEARPVVDGGDCARQLGIMNQRLTGFEELFDEKINSLRDLIHEVVKPKSHLRAIAPKERASGRT